MQVTFTLEGTLEVRLGVMSSGLGVVREEGWLV